MAIHPRKCSWVLRIGLHVLLVSVKVTSTRRDGYGGTRSVTQRGNSQAQVSVYEVQMPTSESSRPSAIL